MIENILKDIKLKLDINFTDNDIKYYTDGATDSVVFSIKEKYLIKKVDEYTYNTQLEFYKIYNFDYYQKFIYSNNDLLYICFEYINGHKYDGTLNNVINTLYNYTSNYKKYEYEGFGYLFDDHKSWYQFLYDEVMYSKNEISDVDDSKVIESLNIIKKYKIDKYLIHGDFGTHNFLINDKIYVIDPMCVVGDYLYDFYFSIFSNYDIFKNLNINYILSFYDRDLKYKKALLLVVFYIRMSRAHKYDIKNYNNYLKIYDTIK